MTPLRHWQIAAIAVVTVAALTLSGCNLLPSGKSSASTAGHPVSAQIDLSTASLNFGSITVGTSKTLHLTVTNSTPTGGPSVTVSKVSASGTGFSASNTLPIDLAPGQSTSLSVAFKPTAAGTDSGSLTIDVVGASDPGTVPLQGVGASTPTGATNLSASPATLSFGSVNIGASKNLTGTITATNSSVTVSSAAWNGSGYSVSGITFPVTVAAGKSVSYTVTFAPQAAGSTPGSISFVSNAPDSPTSETFSGSGTQVAAQHHVNLSWSPSNSQVAGYNVYRGTQSGGPYSRINPGLQPTTTYTDGTVQSGQVYFYVATSVDPQSIESSFSTEVAAVIPTP